MGIFTTPTKTDGEVSELWRWFVVLVQELNKFLTPAIKDVVIGTSETAVAHGQSWIPTVAVATPKANATVWQSKASDLKNCYFTASTSVTCDVKVFR